MQGMKHVTVQQRPREPRCGSTPLGPGQDRPAALDHRDRDDRARGTGGLAIDATRAKRAVLVACAVIVAGEVNRGSYVHSLVLTDIARGWTQAAPIVVRESTLVVETLERIRVGLPFVLH